MTSPGLPVNLDATYADDTTTPDTTVKLHQQYHDSVHSLVNEFATPASAARAAGYTWVYNGTLFVPQALKSSNVGLTDFELTPGGNYTFQLTDLGKLKGSLSSDTAALTWTVPPNSSVAFPVGTTIKVKQRGTGQITIVAGTGVDFTYGGDGPKTAKQGAGLLLTKEFTNSWWIEGGIN